MVETELTREEQIEIELSDKFYHDYFHSFLSQLQLLDDVNDFEHDDRFFGNEDGKHIQYKYKVGDNGVYATQHKIKLLPSRTPNNPDGCYNCIQPFF